MSDVDPTWRVNINKQIVQYTKLVFQRHSSAMEDREGLKEMKEQYEEEISEIKQQSKEHLQAVQQEADGFHSVIEGVVRNEFESKFETAQGQFEVAKERIQKAVADALTVAEAKLVVLKDKLQKLKEQAEGRLSEFRAAAKEIQAVHNKVMMKMDAEMRKKIEQIIAEAREKYEQTVLQTKQKEQEIRAQYERELEELRRALEEAKVSADAALTKRRKELEARLKVLQDESEGLQKSVRDFEASTRDMQAEIEAALKKAAAMKADVLKAREDELNELLEGFKKAQSEHDAKVARIKEKMAREEAEFMALLAKKKEELERERANYQKMLADYEASVTEATAEADRRIKELTNAHKKAMQKLEADYLLFVSKEREKTKSTYQRMCEIERNLANEAGKLRGAMESKLTESIEMVGGSKPKTQEELDAMCKSNEEEFERLLAVLTNLKQPEELSQLLVQGSKLRGSLEIEKVMHMLRLNELEHQKASQMLVARKKHEATLLSLDHEQEMEFKYTDSNHISSMEKAKRQFVLDTKNSEEQGNLTMKHTIEKLKHELAVRKTREIEKQREAWELELAALAAEIEIKSLERKEIEARNKKEAVEKTKKIQELKEEIKQREFDWVEEKQQLIKDWEAKFEKIKKQLAEEEQQNEMVRRMSQKECQKMLEKLKEDLAAEEERKAKEHGVIKKKIEGEKKRVADEEKKLQQEIESMSGNSDTSVRSLEQRLEAFGTERIEKVKAREEKRRQQIDAKNSEMRDVRKQCADELNKKKEEMLQKIQAEEQKLHNTKLQLEQKQIEAYFDVATFEAEKQKELSQAENRKKFELDLLSIELESIHSETERLKDGNKERLQCFSDLEQKRASRQQKEFDSHYAKLEYDIDASIARQQSILKEMKTATEGEDTRKSRATKLGIEYIERLGDLIDERKDVLGQMEDEYRQYESAMIEHDSAFNKVAAASPSTRPESQQSLLSSTASTGRKLRREGCSTGSQRRVPLVEPSVLPRKMKTPI